jgi:hypothetical protein
MNLLYIKISKSVNLTEAIKYSFKSQMQTILHQINCFAVIFQFKAN